MKTVHNWPCAVHLFAHVALALHHWSEDWLTAVCYGVLAICAARKFAEEE